MFSLIRSVITVGLVLLGLYSFIWGDKSEAAYLISSAVLLEVQSSREIILQKLKSPKEIENG